MIATALDHLRRAAMRKTARLASCSMRGRRKAGSGSASTASADFCNPAGFVAGRHPLGHARRHHGAGGVRHDRGQSSTPRPSP